MGEVAPCNTEVELRPDPSRSSRVITYLLPRFCSTLPSSLACPLLLRVSAVNSFYCLKRLRLDLCRMGGCWLRVLPTEDSRHTFLFALLGFFDGNWIVRAKSVMVPPGS
jgi:hypothetical protein